jgi:eukaryotic-like serine/threonine-protein kinase
MFTSRGGYYTLFSHSLFSLTYKSAHRYCDGSEPSFGCVMHMARKDPSLGDTIGRYQLIGEIARGGMGIVYVAAAQGPAGFSKLAALKELKPDLVQDTDFLTMFLDEARLAARLSHPNIVQTNDVDESNGRHFIAMEYLDGRSFYRVLQRFQPRGGFPQRMSLSVLRDVLAALDYAHELKDFDGAPLGFVHRDISPHNVFITFDGHTKVIDFGIAKARDSSLETKTGVLKGRASYMAPEQLTRRAADRRTDIFSCGAMLFEIVAGRRLWQGMNEMEILGHLTTGHIPSLKQACPNASPALIDICNRSLHPMPESRFATAAEMRDAIDEYLWSSGGAPKMGAIGNLLKEEFDTERKKAREIIEAALKRLETGERGHLENVAAAEERGHGTHSGGSGSSMRHKSRMARLPQPPPDTHPPVDPMFATLSPEPPRLTARSLPELFMRHGKYIGATALGLAFIATVVAVALHRGAPPIEAAAVVEPAHASPGAAVRPSKPVELPAPSAPTVPDSIVLSVSVAPSSAQLLIDGDPVPSNPFLGRFPRGTGMHRIRAVAPGYQAKERLVSFAENVMLDLSLDPKPVQREVQSRRREPPPRRQEPAFSPPPTPAPVATPSQPRARDTSDIPARGEWEPPRRRSIDTNNPYGEEK